MRPRTSLRHLTALALLSLACACGGGSSLSAPRGDYPAGIRDGPMVSLPAATEVTIAWRSETLVVGSVEYGPTDAYGSLATGPAGTEHEVALPGLAPHAVHHYRLLAGGRPVGGDHVLRTPPQDLFAPVRFAVLGDTGTGGDEAFAMIARVRALGPEFVLNTGDVAYDDGSALAVRSRYVVPFASLMDHVPVFPTWGNHDVRSAGGQPLADAVVLPTNDMDGTERFYAFDWGMAHVACLDSNRSVAVGSPQREWLAADLRASPAPWKFVFFHHPVYSSSRHGSTAAIQESLVPVFDANSVAVVFNGHDHDYERTHPMLAGSPTDTTGGPDYADPVGTLYVVTGGGGKGLYEAGTRSFTARSESVFHAVQVDLTPTTLTLTAVREDGTTIETVRVTRTP